MYYMKHRWMSMAVLRVKQMKHLLACNFQSLKLFLFNIDTIWNLNNCIYYLKQPRIFHLVYESCVNRGEFVIVL